MEEKSPADKDVSQSITEEPDRMESDEVLSGSDTPEVTENTDSSGDGATTDEKPEISKTPSEPTSGIEVISGSTASASEIPCDGATISDAEERTQEPSSVRSPKPLKEITRQYALSAEVVSRSAAEIPCEESLDQARSEHAGKELGSASEECAKTDMVAESAHSELTGKEIACASETSAVADQLAEKGQSEQVGTENDLRTEVSAIPSEGAEASIDAEPEVLTEKSAPSKFSLSKVIGIISPTKKSKSSRSKSMSPSEKSKPAASSTSNPTEETKVSSEEDHKKKDKDSFFKKVGRKLSKLGIGTKSCASESANLVSDEEIEESEEKEVCSQSKSTEASADKDRNACNIPVWVDNSNRSSLSDKPSCDGTNTTDIPSTLSDADAFPTDSSRRSSEAGENTSQEAVAGSLASSPDEQIQDIKQDKEAEMEGNKDATQASSLEVPTGEKCPEEESCPTERSTTEETLNVETSENCPEEESCSEDNDKSKDKKPESES